MQPMQPNKDSHTSESEGSEESEESEGDEGDEAEGDASGGEIEVRLEQMATQMATQMTKLAETIAQMGLTDAEILRVTPAVQAFRQCARALRSYHGDLYSKSEKKHKDLNFLEPLLAWGEMEEDHNTHRFLQWPGSCSLWYVLCCCDDATLLFGPSPRFEPWQHGRNPIRILMLVSVVWFLRHLFGHDLLATPEPCFPGPHLHQPNGP